MSPLHAATTWRLDMGANLVPGGVQFRVWSPAARRVDLAVEGQLGAELPLRRADDGTWGLFVPGAAAGLRYRYRLDGGDAFPDPYSRGQPEGVHGPSEVVDPADFAWHDQGWRGLASQGLVIYECHVGTATIGGDFDALIGQLPRLQRLGVTAIEIMPVAEFSGTRNWGYDGVQPFAPSRSYGGPAAFRRFVDAAHQHGLGVILDVVYNHLGPEGNYLPQFSPYYFTDRYQTPWGQAVNYDGEHAEWVRKLVLDNARYWLHELHVDGLRLDAAHEIHDERSAVHLLAELSQTLRASVAPRQVVLIAETEQNDVRYLLPVEDGGFGLDAVWADDFHHTMRRYLAGDSEGYFADYEGSLAEVARTAEQGWLYEGQPTRTTGKQRGTSARQQPARQFVLCLQNHDQVGNRAFGDRLTASVDVERYRVASAVLLLLPHTPLLFMGQEFAASTPFLYFTDHSPDLGKLVTEGRRKEFAGFSAFSDPAVRETIPDPQAESTFRRSKLAVEEAERQPGQGVQALYTVLLALRRGDPVFARQDRHALHVRALTADVLAVHWWHAGQERLLLANFGPAMAVDLAAITGQHVEASPVRLPATTGPAGGLGVVAVPSAPPTNGHDAHDHDHGHEHAEVPPEAWNVVLDTGERRFGGAGAGSVVERGLLALPERTAVVLAKYG